jgi:hypothetical protein
MAELGPGPGDTVVLDLLSNWAFMGTDGDGMPPPTVDMSDGKHHIPGYLITAPPSIAKKKILQNCNTIAGSTVFQKIG